MVVRLGAMRRHDFIQDLTSLCVSMRIPAVFNYITYDMLDYWNTLRKYDIDIHRHYDYSHELDYSLNYADKLEQRRNQVFKCN
jgi:hypothetical protein